jgi:hypothetical protein
MIDPQAISNEFQELVRLDNLSWQDGAPAPKTQTVRIVDYKTGKVTGSFELVAGGDHIADQRKVYVKA